MPEINESNIKAAGFDFDQPDPNIFIIKDFISEEERLSLYNLAESKTEQDWVGDYLNGIEDRSEKKYGTRNLEESKLEVTHDWNDKVIYIRDFIKAQDLDKRLAKLFDEEANYSFRSFGVIQRQYTGSELKGHYDQYVDDRMKWAAVIYINEDYVDGELYFSEKQIALKPPSRSLVVFPATEEYWHGVKAVGEGPTRYAMPSFIWSEPEIY